MKYLNTEIGFIEFPDEISLLINITNCRFHCKGCHNKEAWDFNYGNKFTEETTKRILNLLDKNYITGLSILGGEPLEPSNQQGLVDLVKQVKQKFPDKTIWLYSGYTWDYIFDYINTVDVIGNQIRNEILKYCDVLVDGRFEEDKKDLLNKLIDLIIKLNNTSIEAYENRLFFFF